MPSSHSKDKQQTIDKKISKINESLEDIITNKSLKSNIATIKKLFVDDDGLIIREIDNDKDNSMKYAIAYCNGLVNNTIINDNIIRPLILSSAMNKDNLDFDILIKQVLFVNEIKKTNKIKDIVENVTYGDVILFVDGLSEALILNAKLLEKRAIIEPENEKMLVGPREGFTEALLTNLSLIRRKIRTNDLKFKYVTVGDRTNTQGCICYLDSIVNKHALSTFEARVRKIKIDGILDTNYITELTRDKPWTPFRTTGYTERPDGIAAKLLEGGIAFIIDGSPMALTLPYLFQENFQNGEDYYLIYYYTSFSRMLRILGFFLTITVPAFYIAIVAYHKEMLPTQLFINIAISRHNVPLPAAAEAAVMLIVFDIIRETGIRMPSNIGQALSIVGAIVIGQALVEAKLVAAPMIVIIAFTGITSLLVPKMNAPIIFIRMTLLILASTLGLFGLMIGLSLILIHILNLSSYGISQTGNVGDFKFQTMKDTFFRAPWWKMTKRPKSITNTTRLKQAGVK